MTTCCELCPRKCGVDRTKTVGYCKTGSKLKLAKYMVHYGEEPVITGTRGSGAIFLSGCNLRCVFCQNYPISHDLKGEYISGEKLKDIIFSLQDKGVHNINFVTATHYSDIIAKVLEEIKDRLTIPVVYNCGGYESVESLKRLKGLVDIYLPDLKYHSSELSEKYSGAVDYFEKASLAIMEMVKQQPKVIINNGIMEKGVIIRHLVLPKGYKDSIRLMEWVKDTFPENTPLVSVMRQYTPCYGAVNFPEINRKLTTFEYDKVVERCAELGLEGFTQQKGCDTLDMTPDF